MNAREYARHRSLVALTVPIVIAVCLLGSTRIDGSMRTKSARRTASLKRQAASHPSTTPVLVELFTSEGCASCPTADALLARLEREQPVPTADILALEEHVDYWDSLEWHDRFASSQFSTRQDNYLQRLRLASEYTPEMIVDGTEEFAGNDIVQAFHAIARAAGTQKLGMKLSPLMREGSRLTGKVTLSRGTASARHADLYAAVVESSASTQVMAGDNSGRTLNHVCIVREMRRIGSLTGVRAAPLKFSLSVPADASAANLRVVVFLQRAGQGAVLGAISAAAPGDQIASGD